MSNDFLPEDLNEEDEHRAVNHFLTDLGKLITRYSYEYDLSYVEVLGCLDVQKQIILDEIADRALQAYLESEENESPEEPSEDEDPGTEYYE